MELPFDEQVNLRCYLTQGTKLFLYNLCMYFLNDIYFIWSVFDAQHLTWTYKDIHLVHDFTNEGPMIFLVATMRINFTRNLVPDSNTILWTMLHKYKLDYSRSSKDNSSSYTVLLIYKEQPMVTHYKKYHRFYSKSLPLKKIWWKNHINKEAA